MPIVIRLSRLKMAHKKIGVTNREDYNKNKNEFDNYFSISRVKDKCSANLNGWKSNQIKLQVNLNVGFQ